MKCNNCGTEYENARFCPECGAPANVPQTNVPNQAPQYRQQYQHGQPQIPQQPLPQKKKKGCLVVTAIVLTTIIFVALIVIIFGGDKNTSKKPKENNSTASSVSVNLPEGNETFGIGETQATGDIEVTLLSVQIGTDHQFMTPEDGNIFLVCEFEIANNSNEEIRVSSLGSFDAYCDDYALSPKLGATGSVSGKNTIDGTVASGRKISGVVAFEVPESWETFEPLYKPKMFSSNDQISFFVERNEVA